MGGTLAPFSIRSNVTFVSRQALSGPLKVYLCREELDLEIGKRLKNLQSEEKKKRDRDDKGIEMGEKKTTVTRAAR